jgi:hypothetical protein
MNKEQAKFIMRQFEEIRRELKDLRRKVNELEKGNKGKRSKKSN